MVDEDGKRESEECGDKVVMLTRDVEQEVRGSQSMQNA